MRHILPLLLIGALPGCELYFGGDGIPESGPGQPPAAAGDAGDCGGDASHDAEPDAGAMPVDETACHPLTQDCPEGHGCYYLGDGESTCAPHGGKAPGEACTYRNECAPGSVCVAQYNGSARCMQYCGYADCRGEDGQPNHCGCGSGTATCGPDEICAYSWPDSLTAVGLCDKAVFYLCDCDLDPVCP
jgi:hypothetical protein